MKHEHLTLPLEIKAVGDEGTFEGYASVTGLEDLGGDIVEPGAFKATIQESGGRFPLQADHDLSLKARLGYVEATEDDTGLKVKGFFNLDKEVARDVHADMKQAHEAGMPLGMSIGYTLTKKARRVSGIRRLSEVKVWEVTLTQFPMNTAATVTAVKSSAKDFATTFNEAMEQEELRRQRWKMTDALYESLGNALEADDLTDEQKLEALGTSIDQFRAAYLTWAARALAAMKAMEPDEVKAFLSMARPEQTAQPGSNSKDTEPDETKSDTTPDDDADKSTDGDAALVALLTELKTLTGPEAGRPAQA